MDLTIPYTFYPSALPEWLAWVLFLAALFGAIGVGVLLVRMQRPMIGILVVIPAFAIFLITSMTVSMILTFFLHDV